MRPMSRREFVVAGGALLSQSALAQGTKGSMPTEPTLTAGQVVDRIKRQVGIPWMSQTVDVLTTGDNNTPVTGIASTMMATMDVVQRAAAERKNMIVSHETAFYLQQDQTDDIKDNSVLLEKKEFVRKNNIAIFRFHDHWHRMHPDGIAAGMVRQLGWEKNITDPQNPTRLIFPGPSLAKFAQGMQGRLKARTMRVVGDPNLPVRRVVTSWGYCGRLPGINLISQGDVDLLICGETREWELVEFVYDAMIQGRKKALIVVGHVTSEQGGMMLCADWLKGFITEVPIGFIATPEPLWAPDHPVEI